jgi:hypothetical protein
MAPEALRLWFDSRFGCRDGLRGQAFVNRGILHPTRDRVSDEAWLFEVMKGRYGRGDDQS